GGREPLFRQPSRWRISTSTRVGCSLIFVPLQAELLAEPGQGAVELLPQRRRVAADLLGDGGPVVALVAQLDQAEHVGRETAMDLREQLAGLDLLAGTGTARDQLVLGDVIADQAVCPAGGMGLPRPVGRLVPPPGR